MVFCEASHSCDLIVGALDGARTATAKQLRLDPDREKLRVESACFGAHCVKMAVAQLFLKINIFIKHPLDGIRMHINCNRTMVDC
jgi:hypothetical protein